MSHDGSASSNPAQARAKPGSAQTSRVERARSAVASAGSLVGGLAVGHRRLGVGGLVAAFGWAAGLGYAAILMAAGAGMLAFGRRLP